MGQLISEGREIARHKPDNCPDSSGHLSGSHFENVTAPKCEEHLLFERFMCWWNGRHLHGQQPIEPERHFTFFKIWDAFEQSDCPLCYLGRKARSLYLSSLWYENVNDVGLRNRLHRSVGFSPEATSASLAMGDDLGMSIVYRALSGDIADRLHVQQPIQSSEACPVAEHVAAMNRNYARALAAHYIAPDVQELHQKSFGLCLQHIQEVLEALPTADLRQAFNQVEAANFRKLQQELDTFIHKSDYRNREPLGSERDAWIRAAKKFNRQEPLSP